MPVPTVSKSVPIKIYQWRDDTYFFGVVDSEITIEDDEYYVCYKAIPHTSLVDTELDGLYHHYAVWDSKDQQWEDGDI